MRSQNEKAEAFRALHAGEPFVIPNPWDAGSARVLEALGFKALATTSSGFAFTLGRRDGGVSLDELADHTATLARATDLPVSVDLENGFGADPVHAASAIVRVAEKGAVGGSIEDFDPAGHLYDRVHATERIGAAAEAARGLGFPFTLTARAENHIRGNPDLRTRSRDSGPLRRRAPTCSTRPACGRWRRSEQSARRSRDRSTCSRAPASRCRRSSRRARSASAWAAG